MPNPEILVLKVGPESGTKTDVVSRGAFVKKLRVEPTGAQLRAAMRAAATLLSALALQLASSPGAAGAGGKRFESPKDTVRGKFWVHHPKGAPLIDSATYREVGTLKIAPVVIGMWQVSGGHGYRPNAQRVVDDMVVHRKHGFRWIQRTFASAPL